MPSTLSPQDFVVKWRKAELKESASPRQLVPAVVQPGAPGRFGAPPSYFDDHPDTP
jgi:hypothetical protein